MVVVLPDTATTRILFLQAGCFLLILLSFNVAAAASPQITSFSFNFSNKSSYNINDLRFEGNATLNGDLVDLTCNKENKTENLSCLGRMSYNHSVLLYNKSTDEVARFSTRFTFVFQPIDGLHAGDGMAFFLSSFPSRLPPGSAGNFLGLINSSDGTPSGSDRFVAVEFDTYTEPSDHIGINLNSMTSANVTNIDNLNGTMTATITFDGSTRMLEASLHFDSNPSRGTAVVKKHLSEPFDVLLPPEVAVGFSAATGTSAELHQILSWSFNSTMMSKDLQKDSEYFEEYFDEEYVAVGFC